MLCNSPRPSKSQVIAFLPGNTAKWEICLWLGILPQMLCLLFLFQPKSSKAFIIPA